MASFVNTFNLFLFFIFSLCYMYQVVYIIVVLVKDYKKKPHPELNTPQHRFAVLIAGRNEEKVVGELVKSLKEQDYPEELIDVFVVADNCTDSTAEVARSAGAQVFERDDKLVTGKSHALDYAINKIRVLYGHEDGRTDYDAYIVFDADNVVDPGFVAAMNRGFNQGYQVLTSYRNSKNYDSNWVSAGSGLWFLREAKFLSNARSLVGSSCAISGTGFAISSDIIETNGGWIHHLLTEDIEFSTDCITNGIKIGYAGDAYVYDEQPVTMRDSYRQRLRWARGFYQVLIKYGKNLFRGIFGGKDHRTENKKFACYDMFMTIAPAMLLTLSAVIANFLFCLTGIAQMISVAAQVQTIAGGAAISSGANWLATSMALLSGSLFQGDALSTFGAGDVDVMLSYAQARSTIITSVVTLCGCFLSFAGIMLVFGAITTFVEWDHIHAKNSDKIKYIFTFPVYMLTYIPIAVVAVFKKVEWKPIPHTVVRSTADVLSRGQ